MVAYPAAPIAAPWLPSDNGLLAASGDPAEFAATIGVTGGTLYLAKIMVRAPFTISNLLFPVTTPGSGTSTGSFAGVYSPSGALIASSADCATQLTESGANPIAMQAPVAVGSYSFVWAAILCNLSVTQATLARAGASSASTTMGATAATFRFAINGTLLSSLPASITPASNTATPNALLVGVT